MALTKLNSASMPTGSVLQVVSQQITDQKEATTSFSAMTGSNIAITPNYTSSKILIEFGYHVYINAASSGVWRGASARLMNVTANTVLLPGNGVYGDSLIFAGSSNERLMTYSNGSFIHSPSTTSSITYGLEILKNGDAGSVTINSGFGRKGYITLTEIKQ